MWGSRKKIDDENFIQSDVSPKSGKVSLIFLKRHEGNPDSVNRFVDKPIAKAKFNLNDVDGMAGFIEQQGLENGTNWADTMLSKVPLSRRK